MARRMLLAASLAAARAGGSTGTHPILPPVVSIDVGSGPMLELDFFNETFFMRNTSLPCTVGGALGGPMKCPPIAYHMMGYMPADQKDHPAYLFVSGAGPWQNDIRNQPFTEQLPEMDMIRAMARRGYAAAISEFPFVMGGHFRCEAISEGTMSLMSHAREVFSWSGPRDTTSNGPLSVLCRLPGVDCSIAIALHGHSVGGLLTNLAPRFAPVTGMLLWGAGSRTPYGYSCCGLASGNTSCCEENAGDGIDAPLREAVPVSGSELPCEMYNATGWFLHRSRRRLVIAEYDHEYGDCDLDMSEQIGVYCNHTNGWNPFGSLILGRRDSGYDCGNATTCIMPDGSGYIVPDDSEIGILAVRNAHNFHTVLPNQQACIEQGERGGPAEDDEEVDCAGYILNDLWVNSTEPWGLYPSLEWLATTALRP